MSFKVVPHPDSPLQVWFPPDAKRLYSIGVDVGDGGGHGSRWGADAYGSRPAASTIQVVDAATRIQCAEYQTWGMLPADFGLKVAQLGRWYGGREHEAFVVVEANKSGISTIDAMRYQASYANLYTRRTFDYVTQKFSNKIGWETTNKTRPVLVNIGRTTYQQLPEAVMSRRTQEEIHSFLYQETSPGSGDFRPQAAPGELDDLIFALLLAWFGCDYALASQPDDQPKLDEPPDAWVWKATERVLDAQKVQRQYGALYSEDEIPIEDYTQEIPTSMLTVPEYMWE